MKAFCKINTEVRCPVCTSTNLVKKGFSGERQKYKCKDCGRTFVENSKFDAQRRKILPKVDIPCPHCNSDNIYRKEKVGDNQRYYCRDCKKSFSDNTNPEYLKPVEYQCPYCGGKLNRSGKGKLGQNEYYCTSCHKSCSGDPPKKQIIFYKTNSEVKCPYCGSMNLNKAGTLDGIQRYLCIKCGKAFTSLTKIRLEEDKKEPKTNEKCPYCFGKHIVSAGVTSSGNLRFRCTACKKTYTKDKDTVIQSTKKVISKEMIEKMNKMLESGYSKSKIAEELKVSKSTILRHTPKTMNVSKNVEIKSQEKMAETKMTEEDTIDEVKVNIIPEIKMETSQVKEIEPDKIDILKHERNEIKIKKELELREEKLFDLEMKKQKDMLNMLKKRQREDFITDIVSEYEKKLAFENIPIPDSFILKFNELKEKFINLEIEQEDFETAYTSILNLTLSEMLEIQKRQNQINKETKYKLICEEVLRGVSEQKVADKYEISLSRVRELVKPLYEKEEITQSQKHMIIQYGIYYKVPVDYMAEYIPCSEHKCIEVMADFKSGKIIFKPQTNQITMQNGYKKVAKI